MLNTLAGIQATSHVINLQPSRFIDFNALENLLLWISLCLKR